ncbi:MAG: hypothetical protein ACON3Z_02440 [Bradymonadia bacterium]
MKRYSILITALLAVFAHSAASAETSADFEELKERADAALAELDEARRDEEATSPASQTDSETDMSTSAEHSHQQIAAPSGDLAESSVNTTTPSGANPNGASSNVVESKSPNQWGSDDADPAIHESEDDSALIAQEVEDLKAEIDATQMQLQDLSDSALSHDMDAIERQRHEAARLRRIRAEYRYQLALLLIEAALLQAQQDNWAMQQRRILAKRHARYRNAGRFANWRLQQRRRILRDRQLRHQQRMRANRAARIQQRRIAARSARIQQRRSAARTARIQQRRNAARNARIQQRRNAARNARVQQRHRAQGERVMTRAVRTSLASSNKKIRRGQRALRRHNKKQVKVRYGLTRSLNSKVLRSSKKKRGGRRNRLRRSRRDS